MNLPIQISLYGINGFLGNICPRKAAFAVCRVAGAVFFVRHVAEWVVRRSLLNLNTALGLQPFAAIGAQVGSGLEGVAAPHVAFVAGVKVDAPRRVAGGQCGGAQGAFHTGGLRHIRLALSIAGLLLLTACNTAQEQVNACLPAAIAAKEIMQKQGVPAKVLIVRWKEAERSRGHAYAIFVYGKKWSYDKDFGSIPLTSGEDGPMWEAFEANLLRGHKGDITEAYYLEK